MSSVIDQLAEIFRRFPGIGPRQAKRFVYHLLQQDASTLSNLARVILKLSKEINRCSRCYCFYNPTENYQEQCAVCHDTTRNLDILLLVAKDADLEVILKSYAYDGYYFVLGGLMALTDSTPDPSLRTRELYLRVQSELAAGSLKEIILALSANTEGNHTAEYIQSFLAPLGEQYPLKVSRLGRGLSTGTELEYSDTDTIMNALKNRQ